MAEGKFVTAINCMDGRTQEPVVTWMKENYQADYVDMITEPGPDGILANRNAELTASIKNRVMISVEKHGSKVIALIAHGDCAGNPVSEEEHYGHLRKGMEVLRNWDLNVTIVGLWISDKDWQPEVFAVITP